MGKGRFLNQKLGKRVSRKVGLVKSNLSAEKAFQFQSKSNFSRTNSPPIRKGPTAPLPPAKSGSPENPVD